MKTSKHWFFDLDGTLADTAADIVVAWKGALAALGRDLSRFDEVFSIGPTLEKVVYELYDDATPELVSQLLERFKPLYDESGFPNTVPYAGIPELLARLKASGRKIYIVTNKRHAPTQGIARKLGWDRLFDGIWSYDSLDVKYKKGELLARLLREMAIAKDDAVMVGDTNNDFAAARANGIRSVGVRWGYGKPEELALADATVTNPSDLV